MTKIIVGKNVATINGHEFPVDTDLQLVDGKKHPASWLVASMDEHNPFVPVQDDQVTEQTFNTYAASLQTSMAMNTYGKMNKLYNRKVRGVKIIPGHGVFTLPSKMNVYGTRKNTLSLQVFQNTQYYQSFQNPDYNQMVCDALNYYNRHIKEVAAEENHHLYIPVTVGQDIIRSMFGIRIPRGVYVQEMENGLFAVSYYSSMNGTTKYVGSCRNHSELNALIVQALMLRSVGQSKAMKERHVDASYQSLRVYMAEMS